MKFVSEIRYWVGNENILNVPFTKEPKIGDIITIDTRSDEMWFDAHFNNKDLFDKGVNSEYKVISITRYYKSLDIVAKDELGPDSYIEFPSKKITEVFEVFLEKIN